MERRLAQQRLVVGRGREETDPPLAPRQQDGDPPPAAPEEHLLTYQVKAATKFPKLDEVIVTVQFGARHYDVLKSAELSLTTAVDPDGVPPALVGPSTDEFQCYKVKDRKNPGPFVAQSIALTD
ncbi:MAG: hypothetical protein ABIR79_11005 [Candidatus Binatia bacterium]